MGNATIAATENLRSALRHLRDRLETRYLWADAICINQADLCGRAEQVALMRDIYRSATCTIVWLGLTYESSSTALSSAVVICGRKKLDWKTFANGIQCGFREELFSVTVLEFAQTKSCENFQALTRLYREGLGQDSSPAEKLLDLLTEFRTHDSTDPRDKVSLLGMVEGVEIDLDYRLRTANAYANAAAAVLTHSGNVDILGHAPATYDTVIQSQLPSWVPDWSSTKALAKSLGKQAGKYPPRIRDNKPLILGGHILDTLSEVGDILTPPEEDDWFNDIDSIAVTVPLVPELIYCPALRVEPYWLDIRSTFGVYGHCGAVAMTLTAGALSS